MADMIHWQAIQFSKRCSKAQHDLRRRAKMPKQKLQQEIMVGGLPGVGRAMAQKRGGPVRYPHSNVCQDPWPQFSA